MCCGDCKSAFSAFYRGWQESRAAKIGRTALSWFNKVAPPPTIASLAGLVVGCVPFLKNIMFPAQSAPLGFLTTALDTIADAFVFLISFILGAVLQKGPGPGTRSLGWLPILMTVLNRFLFLPALGALSAAAHVRCAHFDSSRPISPGRRLFHANKILVHLNVCHQSSEKI